MGVAVLAVMAGVGMLVAAAAWQFGPIGLAIAGILVLVWGFLAVDIGGRKQ